MASAGVINFRLGVNLIARLDRIAGLSGGTRSDAARQALYVGILAIEKQYELSPPEIVEAADVDEMDVLMASM